MDTAKKPIFLNRHTPAHLVTLVLLAGVGTMAMNVFLPSLPGMMAYFDTTAARMQLSVSMFLAFNAVFQIIIGPLSDRYGRRPVLLTCMVIFVVASFACLYTTSIWTFLFCRVIQAAVIAGMVASRASLRDLYSPAAAASMIGYVTMGMTLVPMVAPGLGGILDEFYGWQASFWLLGGFGVFVTILSYFDFGETNVTRSASVVAQFKSYPELFRSRRFWGYVFAASTAAGAFFAYLGAAPFIGEKVFNLDGGTLGFYISSPAVGYMVGNFISGRYSQRMGINRMIVTGAILSTSGLTVSLLLFLFFDPVAFAFFGATMFMGLGNGMCLPNAMSGMMSVRPHLAGSATGVGGAIMTGGGAVLAAVASQIVDAESGATPLLALMIVCSALPALGIYYIRSRESSLEDLQN